MWNVLLLIVGFLCLIKGADWFVDGASKLAGRFGIPQLVIGLTIVAMGTSLPEAAVSIQGAIKGTAGIAVGNVLGSNIFNVLVILGVTALLAVLPLQRSTLFIEIPYMLLITVVMLVLGMCGMSISRVDGALLWGLFLVYLGYLWWLTRRNKEQSETGEEMWSVAKCLLFLVIGGALIVFGSDLTVDGACGLAAMAGISERVVGLTIVACGTSLPELVTSLVAAKKKHVDIAIGNIVGSNIFNILFVIGTAALITPIPFEQAFIADALIALAAGIVLWLGVVRKQQLRRPCGVIMLAGYGVYLGYLLIK
ncbi:MAG: calcium/sodium antiporter [Eubacterium sp.]|nr:calcium/sodium antiporter [Eubacterium sp.]